MSQANKSSLPKDLQQLIEAACEGTLDAAELAKLEARLRADKAAAQAYLEAAHLHADLHLLALERHSLDAVMESVGEAAAQSTGNPSAKSESGAPTGSRTSGVASRVFQFFAQPTPLSMTVAALVIGLLITAMAFMAPPFYRAWLKPARPDSGNSYAVVAELSGLHQAVWADEMTSAHRGAYLVAGTRIALQEGVAEVTYRNGTVVVLEAPFEYTITTDNAGLLASGDMSASVFGTTGFAVETPLLTVVDLGTRFGLAVSDDAVDVVVYEGTVEARRPYEATETTTIEEQEGYRFFASSVERISPASMRPQRSFSSIVQAAVEETARRYQSEVLADQPAAYWPLVADAQSWYADRSEHKAHLTPYKGAFDQFPGPWGEVNVYLNRTVAVQLPDATSLLPSSEGLTVEAWVWGSGDEGTIGRVASAVGCWGLGFRHGTNTSQVRFTHWTVMDYDFQSQLPKRRWIHVAVTVDAAQTARLYVDGQLREQIAGQPPVLPTETDAYIGASNANMGEPWHGGLAHVAVYQRALTAEQVQAHYQISRTPVIE